MYLLESSFVKEKNKLYSIIIRAGGTWEDS
jgi:hypothetical protein